MIERLKRVWRAPWIPPSKGRAPYLWSLCLLFMLWKYVYIQASALEYFLLVLTLLAFLPVYFLAYWSISQRHQVLWILLSCLLGVLWVPYNWSASTFFIFAASMAAGLQPVRRAYCAIAAIIALALLACSLTDMAAVFMVPILIIGIPVGISAVMDGQLRHSHEALIRKQEEVEHIATIAERERISRDLHDLLGHTLSLITLKAELAGKLAGRDAEAARREMADIERCARDALSEVRSAVTGYRQTGFAHEIATARATLGAASVTLETRLDDIRVPAPTENVMSLVLREAVTNIVRHAKAATRCEVSLAMVSEMIVLRIADDGAEVQHTIRHGNGLFGMQERVAALNGRLALSVERGLALELTFPMEKPA